MTQERSMESILREIREISAREEDQAGIGVYFVCSKCSLPYRTMQLRRSKPVSGRMDCLDCGGQVHRWVGIYDFVDWQPVRPESPDGSTH